MTSSLPTPRHHHGHHGHALAGRAVVGVCA